MYATCFGLKLGGLQHVNTKNVYKEDTIIKSRAPLLMVTVFGLLNVVQYRVHTKSETYIFFTNVRRILLDSCTVVQYYNFLLTSMYK